MEERTRQGKIKRSNGLSPVIVGVVLAALVALYLRSLLGGEVSETWRILLGLILLVLVGRYLFMLTGLFSSYTITAPAATATTPCPTTDTLTGEGEYETAPKTTKAAAIGAANDLLQGRANTEAGLAVNAYTCPNPACPTKTPGAVTATAKVGFPTATQFSLFAILATLFDLGQNVYWSGKMKYTWSTTVTCR